MFLRMGSQTPFHFNVAFVLDRQLSETVVYTVCLTYATLFMTGWLVPKILFPLSHLQLVSNNRWLNSTPGFVT
jgi:hypothetical protein